MTKLRGHAHRHATGLALLLRASDCVIILGSLLGIFALSHAEQSRFNEYAIFGMASALAFLFFSEIAHLYRSFRGEPPSREYSTIWRTWLLAFGMPLVFGFVTKRTAFYSRIIITIWFFFAPFIICIQRSLTRHLLRTVRRMGVNYRRACVCGAGEQADALIRTIREAPEMGIRLTGIYESSAPGTGDDNTRTGSLDDMIRAAQSGDLDIVYLAFPIHEMPRVKDIINSLADSTVDLYVVPSFETFHLFQSPVTVVGNTPALCVFDTPLQGVDGMVKRMEDLALGSIALGLALLPMVCIGILIKLTSRGPAIFKQHRYGVDGREIIVWKFRTMAVCEDSSRQIAQAQKEDARITPIGRVLRRTSLDELPQLFNVLQGRMSLVGPRPHAVAHNEEYRKLIHGYMLRHKVRPGITGLAQIRGWRGETKTLEKMEKRVESDLEYIRGWSLSLDLKILFLTLFVGFRHQNAY
ncbi:MAG: undecaprenyl-phosphate glucose phosphotransferase [Verrucomicrobia bacterium]|jgi:putative colanic acid biosysnthesis UDP-glucose lipid carrier transferase|nr:undecaprenyl-phosphate glucose phosphotransferase [Verrucomicrobiota bacterium]